MRPAAPSSAPSTGLPTAPSIAGPNPLSTAGPAPPSIAVPGPLSSARGPARPTAALPGTRPAAAVGVPGRLLQRLRSRLLDGQLARCTGNDLLLRRDGGWSITGRQRHLDDGQVEVGKRLALVRLPDQYGSQPDAGVANGAEDLTRLDVVRLTLPQVEHGDRFNEQRSGTLDRVDEFRAEGLRVAVAHDDAQHGKRTSLDDRLGPGLHDRMRSGRQGCSRGVVSIE